MRWKGVRRAAALFLGASLVMGCAPLEVVEDDQRPSASPSSTPTTHTPTTSAPASSGTPTPSEAVTPSPSPSSTPSPGAAERALATLRVRGRGPMTGYDRGLFGQAWLDADRNGCDTRNDILRRDLARTELDPRTRGCVVLRGVLDDPYTGRRIDFVRGEATVDVDHVVALANGWVSGAARWDVTRRAAFANDPLNLLAVGAEVNSAKGAGDAATWLPPRRAFRCGYVARQVAVKAKFGLSVTPAERDAIALVLSRCPGQGLPPDSGAATAVPFATVPGADRTVGPGEFRSCAEARAAGAAPVRRGDPGYGPHLDGDGDGVACE